MDLVDRLPGIDRLRGTARHLVGRLLDAGWTWIGSAGAIGPDDPRARRFHHVGRATLIGFPPGPVYGTESVSIGSETLICPFVSLAVGMPGEVVPPERRPVVRIGDRCTIGRGNSIVARSGVVIEDDVTTAPNVYITDHNHGYDDPRVPIARQWPADAKVRIGAGSWLGTGVVVLPGADIGRNVAVAANSVVRGRVPDACVVAGVPARIVRRYDPEKGWDPPLPERSVTPPEGFVAR